MDVADSSDTMSAAARYLPALPPAFPPSPSCCASAARRAHSAISSRLLYILGVIAEGSLAWGRNSAGQRIMLQSLQVNSGM